MSAPLPSRAAPVDDPRMDWDLPHPHVVRFAVDDAEIDEYRHVNNAVYLTWCERVAWDHSTALGLGKAHCLSLDRGMANVRATIAWLRPALPGDVVEMGTWMLTPAPRVRALRRFQVRRASDATTLARIEIEYVCLELSTGRAVRAPREFTAAYAARADVLAALAGAPVV